METIEKAFVDKSSFGPGPWEGEPDKIQFPDPATGLPCLIVRNKRFGHLCGYVGVSEGHPLFEKLYPEIYDENLEVHGGITFSEFCVPDEKEHGICHTPGPGEPDKVWWFGFDCAHGCDISPGILASGILGGALEKFASYKGIGYVKAQCARLAKQLKEKAT